MSGTNLMLLAVGFVLMFAALLLRTAPRDPLDIEERIDPSDESIPVVRIDALERSAAFWLFAADAVDAMRKPYPSSPFCDDPRP